jgi:PAS domain S-box-containing protein
VKLALSNSDDGGLPDALSNRAWNRRVRNVLLFAAGATLYAALATHVTYFSGPNVTRLSPFFVGAAGYFFGFRAGVGASLVAIVVHTLILGRSGHEGPLAMLHYRPAVQIATVLIGPLAGRLRTITDRLRGEVERREKAERELGEVEQRFQQIANAIEDALWIRPVERTHVIYVSPAFERVFGVSPAAVEKLPDAILGIVHPEDRPALEEKLRSRADQAHEIEYRIVSDDERVRWIQSREVPVRDRNGSVRMIAGVATDITDAKNTATALRTSERKYQDLVEKIPAVVYVAALDRSLPTLYVSPQIEFVLGYGQDEWMSEPEMFTKACHPDDAARVSAQRRECTAQKKRFVADYRMIARNGSVRWFHDEADLIPGENGEPMFLQGVLRDVTTRKGEVLGQPRGAQLSPSTPPRGGDGAPVSAHVHASPESARGSETVLVASDDATVREPIRDVLCSRGYRALLAEDGRAGLEVAGSSGPIDLLIADVVMPRMNGRELAEELRLKHPRLKVLYISGYIGSASVRVAELGPNTSFLSKPFSTEALGRKIRLLLDSPDSPDSPPGPPPGRAPGRPAVDSRSA